MAKEKTRKPEKKWPTYKGQPMKVVVNAPIGPGGSHVRICEFCEGVVTYLVPDEVRIAYCNGLLERATEILAKM